MSGRSAICICHCAATRPPRQWRRLCVRRGLGSAMTWPASSPRSASQALKKLKFSELLPPQLAMRTMAARTADHRGAGLVAAKPIANEACQHA